ncbi:MAG: histidine phosphatase family protein [Cytophagales bacterium]|nr:MAG: histidine phosphatase family protein [Cytophagales bacterium]
MKTLYLIRHAKSSWKDSALADFDRPLNSRGKRDLPFMAKKLKELEAAPHLILASPALRAKITAQAFAETFQYSPKDIEYHENIYEGSAYDLLSIVKKVLPLYHEVILVGHNPQITAFSNLICDKVIENIPTSGIVKIEFKLKKWSSIAPQTGKMIWFEYPKLYQLVNEE